MSICRKSEGNNSMSTLNIFQISFEIWGCLIGIVSDGGIAETTFIVQAKSSVNTSDQTDLLLWGGIMLMSAGLIAVIQALRKYSSYNNM